VVISADHHAHNLVVRYLSDEGRLAIGVSVKENTTLQKHKANQIVEH